MSVINTYQNAVYDKVTIDAENTKKVVFILTILWNEVKADIIVFPEFQQNQVNYKILKNVAFS